MNHQCWIKPLLISLLLFCAATLSVAMPIGTPSSAIAIGRSFSPRSANRTKRQPAFRMACLFTDHMVLQRDQQLPVWGWAAPGRPVTVKICLLYTSDAADE